MCDMCWSLHATEVTLWAGPLDGLRMAVRLDQDELVIPVLPPSGPATLDQPIMAAVKVLRYQMAGWRSDGSRVFRLR